MLLALHCRVFLLLLTCVTLVRSVEPPSVDYSSVMRQVEKLIKLGGPDFDIRWPGVDVDSQIIIQKGVSRWIRTSKFRYLTHIKPQEILAIATVPDTAVWSNWADLREGERTFVILSVYGKPTRLEPLFAPRIHGLLNIAPTQQHAFELWFAHVSETFESMHKRMRPT